MARHVRRRFHRGRHHLDHAPPGEHFGWLGLIWALDAPTSSELTRQRLGWRPAGPDLIEDLEQGHYFRYR